MTESNPIHGNSVYSDAHPIQSTLQTIGKIAKKTGSWLVTRRFDIETCPGVTPDWTTTLACRFSFNLYIQGTVAHSVYNNSGKAFFCHLGEFGALRSTRLDLTHTTIPVGD